VGARFVRKTYVESRRSNWWRN